ncbi:MAG: transcriptional regulator NrdR [Candidatus Kerfeldbacteria bacterium]|nr:transcriptional regulator NrdR [Candidatus Kerfeldbacteria bacterium]
MQCPACHAEDTRVIDTRVIAEGSAIRRRRECSKCSFRFSTIEEIELLSLSVRKVTGAEEPYDRDKLVNSMKLALGKRPVTSERIRRLAHAIEQEIQTLAHNDTIETKEIGALVMKHLRKIDKVGYIRYASVYKSFDDVSAFEDELEHLTPKKRKK